MNMRPTRVQYENFAKYLCEAHSWYKHLSLMDGGPFVVFVAPDAGIGRLVFFRGATGYSLVTPEEGSEFTEEHPRHHYGWKTTKEYRTRFGYLDYSCYQESDGSYGREVGPPVRLSVPLVERCEFVLYPYVHRQFAWAVMSRLHVEALAELRSGAAHAARDDVLELARLAKARRPAQDALAEAEAKWVIDRRWGDTKPWPGEQSDALRHLLKIDTAIDALTESLRDRESDKIRRALALLDDWLLRNQAQEA